MTSQFDPKPSAFTREVVKSKRSDLFLRTSERKSRSFRTQLHPSFSSLPILPSLETSSPSPANGTSARAACLSPPGITPQSDREDETPPGLTRTRQQRLGLPASVFRGKRDPAEGSVTSQSKPR